MISLLVSLALLLSAPVAYATEVGDFNCHWNAAMVGNAWNTCEQSVNQFSASVTAASPEIVSLQQQIADLLAQISALNELLSQI